MEELVAQARKAQRGKYEPDEWIPVRLKALTTLWKGIDKDDPPEPFPPKEKPREKEKKKGAFFFSEEGARDARGAYVGDVPHRFAQTLWRSLQVDKDETEGFRLGIREFVVDLDTNAAMSVCLVNTDFGMGSLVQYYLHDGWDDRLHPTGREHKFPKAGYR